MKIKLQEIKIRDLVKGYVNKEEEGVLGYGGLLNIRPKYQREFVYKDAQRKAVIDTISKDFPLNVMYWAQNSDGTFEIIDGQQRTISICQFINGDFSVENIFNNNNPLAFHNLQEDQKEKILDYKLSVYFCEGTDSEKLKWFETINIAGEKLTEQELRNAVYSGSFITDAKRYFSKTGCPAYNIASDYINGNPIRQDYLEIVLHWISEGDIEKYMSKHQHDGDALHLWEYFQVVINWVKSNFIEYRKEMKGLNWGELYNKNKDKKLNPQEIENEVFSLMEDEEIENKKGIYQYIFDKKEKYLNLRTFSDKDKRVMYERCDGNCANKNCEYVKDRGFYINEMEADHITPWSEGGKTNLSNGQMLCIECNRRKSDR